MGTTNSYVERLNRAREEKGLSTDALARLTGYPTDLVVPLLDGSSLVVSRELHTKLCQVLRLDADEMWREREAAGKHELRR